MGATGGATLVVCGVNFTASRHTKSITDSAVAPTATPPTTTDRQTDRQTHTRRSIANYHHRHRNICIGRRGGAVLVVAALGIIITHLMHESKQREKKQQVRNCLPSAAHRRLAFNCFLSFAFCLANEHNVNARRSLGAQSQWTEFARTNRLVCVAAGSL